MPSLFLPCSSPCSSLRSSRFIASGTGVPVWLQNEGAWRSDPAGPSSWKRQGRWASEARPTKDGPLAAAHFDSYKGSHKSSAAILDAPCPLSYGTTRVSLRSLVAGAAIGFAAAVGVSLDANAAPSARLVYARGPGATECPGEEALRQAVAQRVGYDPFFAWAPLTLSVELLGEDGYLRGRIMVEKEGLERGSQVIEARRGGACAELLQAVALAVTVAFDAATAGRARSDQGPIVARGSKRRRTGACTSFCQSAGTRRSDHARRPRAITR